MKVRTSPARGVMIATSAFAAAALCLVQAGAFVGWPYYNIDGTFTMYNIDDTPKMQGDWTVAEDGSSRFIRAVDGEGNTLFERTVPITVPRLRPVPRLLPTTMGLPRPAVTHPWPSPKDRRALAC